MVGLDRVFKGEVESTVRALLAARVQQRSEEAGLSGLGDSLAESFGIEIPAPALAGARTCEEVVDATLAEFADECLRGFVPDSTLALRARVTNGDGAQRWYLERTVPCTPYAIETICEDAVQAGPGARVDVTVAADPASPVLAWIERRFAVLARKGILVRLSVARAGGGR